ncbi:MAG: hypothetical protein RL653_3000 [Pseudomonadota bacterium]|jgi:hypothetical protein
MGEHEAVFELEGRPARHVRFRVPQEGPVQADLGEGSPPREEAAVSPSPLASSPAAPPGPRPAAGEAPSAPVQARAQPERGSEESRADPALGAQLARHWAALSFCHNVARAKDRAVPVRGRVVLEWVLLPGGRVEQVRVVEDSLRSPAVSSCLVSQLGRLRLAAGPGPLAVRYPVQFPLLGPAGAHLGVESRPAKR